MRSDADNDAEKSASAIKKYLREELPGDIAANRAKCTGVLFGLLCIRPSVTTIDALTEFLSQLADEPIASVDLPECQQILDELVRANLVVRCGPHAYVLTDPIRNACGELAWNFGIFLN